MANVLTGRVNPSGKLTETWPMTYADAVSGSTFGHGLSYTTFAYDNLHADRRCVSLRVTNTGSVPGAEVVQLYIAPPQDGLFRLAKELKGFARVELEPGEPQTVTFTLADRSYAVWSDGRYRSVRPAGTSVWRLKSPSLVRQCPLRSGRPEAGMKN